MEMLMEAFMAGIHELLVTSPAFEFFPSVIVFVVPETGGCKAYLTANSARVG